MARRTGLHSGHALALGAGVLALGIAASIQAAGAVDSTDAQAIDNPGNHATESIDSCMRKWDPGTHMTREAWRQSCTRIKNERESYMKDR